MAIMDESKVKQEAINKFQYEVADEMDMPRHFGAGGGIKYGSADFKSRYFVQKMIDAQKKGK